MRHLPHHTCGTATARCLGDLPRVALSLANQAAQPTRVAMITAIRGPVRISVAASRASLSQKSRTGLG